MSHMRAKKIEALCKVNDARHIFRKGQPSWFEPLGKDVLHALGILFGFTEADARHRRTSRPHVFREVDLGSHI
jgi:hypothetical protein